MAPVPLVSAESAVADFAEDRAKRRQGVVELIRSCERLGVGSMENFDEIGVDLPSEDMFGMSFDLPMCSQYNYTCLCQPQVFLEKVRGPVIVDAYRRYRTLLQLLSFQTGDFMGLTRWVCECPVHMFFIRELVEAFPDAKLVW
jgi:hypothetical protein